MSKPIEAVKQSIRDATSDDPQPDWKDSLGDALDVLEAVKVERDDLLAALKRLNTKTLTRPPALYSDIAPPHYSFNEDDAQAIREAIAKAGGAK